MTDLQDKLKYYLGTKLKYQRIAEHVEGGGLYPVEEELKYDNIDLVIANCKSMTVESYNDGREFVPIQDLNLNIDEYRHEKVSENESNYCFRINNTWYDYKQLPFYKAMLLISWGFWPFDQSLFDTGEILDKEKIEK